MKQVTIANLYPIAKKIAVCDLPYQLAWDLVTMMDEMKPIADFQLEKRRELIKKYKPEYVAETSEFKFKTVEDAKDFQQKQSELDELECEIKTHKIRIPLDFLEEGRIKPNELMVLRESELIEIYKISVVNINTNENTTDESTETEEEESK